MSPFTLNLARRPFVNQRPVVRLAVFLWVAGGGLAIANGWFYYSYQQATRSQRAGLAAAAASIAEEQERLARAEAELGGLDLAHQNDRAVYLNDRIAERTLSWSGLFDDLASVLPRAVRLFRVTPQRPRDRAREGRESAGRPLDHMVLSLTGAAEHDEALLELVDALFGHPAFADPDLRREAQVATGQIQFDLSVTYRPERSGASGAGAASPAAYAATEEAANESSVPAAAESRGATSGPLSGGGLRTAGASGGGSLASEIAGAASAGFDPVWQAPPATGRGRAPRPQPVGRPGAPTGQWAAPRISSSPAAAGAPTPAPLAPPASATGRLR